MTPDNLRNFSARLHQAKQRIDEVDALIELLEETGEPVAGELRASRQSAVDRYNRWAAALTARGQNVPPIGG